MTNATRWRRHQAPNVTRLMTRNTAGSQTRKNAMARTTNAISGAAMAGSSGMSGSHGTSSREVPPWDPDEAFVLWRAANPVTMIARIPRRIVSRTNGTRYSVRPGLRNDAMARKNATAAKAQTARRTGVHGEA